jgi:ATP-dependent Clp protease protease subunit
MEMTMPKNKAWFKMAVKNDTAEIEIFDEIGGWFGSGLADFKARFDEVKSAANIHVSINSIGGDVFEGMAMYNLLAKERAKVDVEVVGLAASIASIVALAGKSLVIDKGAFFMIHNPISIMAGNSDDFRKRAELLDTMQGQFVSIYKEKSGLTNKEIQDMMDAETWMTADEAIEKGFADEAGDEVKMAAKADSDIVAKYGFTHVPVMLARASEPKQITNPRDLETLLRDSGGMSRSQAVAIVANGWKAVAQGEPDPAPVQGEPVLPKIDYAMQILEAEIDLEARRIEA